MKQRVGELTERSQDYWRSTRTTGSGERGHLNPTRSPTLHSPLPQTVGVLVLDVGYISVSQGPSLPLNLNPTLRDVSGGTLRSILKL